jgi:type I restriction enzyme R subunit
MTPKNWTEAALSEDPAVALLAHLGYQYVAPEQLDAERDTYKDAVLAGHLRRAVERLNPHLTSENVGRAVRAITHANGTSLAEVNQALHVAITHGVTVQQDMGRGVQGQTVRVIDFDRPAANELIVTRQFKVKGSTKHIKADAVVFVNGLPLAVLELKNPTLGDIWLHEAVDQLVRYQEAKEEFRDQGAPQLFNTVQLLVAACGQRAAYWKRRSRRPSAANPRRRTWRSGDSSSRRTSSTSFGASSSTRKTPRPRALFTSCRGTRSSWP